MTVSDTKVLLRPDQVEATNDEIKRVEGMLDAPRYIQDQIQDRGALMRQLNSLKTMLDTQSPKPFPSGELDAAIAEEKTLLDEITQGMPTSEEMRHAPPGVVGQHIQWEERNKDKILRWKNLRRRLFPDDPQASNLEKYRPREGGRHNLDDSIVPVKSITMAAATPVPGAVASEEELSKIKELDSELADMFSVMNGPQRARVLDVVRQIMVTDASDWRTLPWAARKRFIKEKTGRGPLNMEEAEKLMAEFEAGGEKEPAQEEG